MGVYSGIKKTWDTATTPIALGGWLFLPFFGATALIASEADPSATIMDTFGVFFGPVAAAPVASMTTGLVTFTTQLAAGATTLGATALSTMGVSMAAGGLTTAFSFATGGAIIAAGLYGANMLMKPISSPSPA